MSNPVPSRPDSPTLWVSKTRSPSVDIPNRFRDDKNMEHFLFDFGEVSPEVETTNQIQPLYQARLDLIR